MLQSCHGFYTKQSDNSAFNDSRVNVEKHQSIDVFKFLKCVTE